MNTTLELINTGELVAVYGSLRSGAGNHRIIEDCERETDGLIPPGIFSMRSLGGYPGILKVLHPSQPTSAIVVEVYRINNNYAPKALDSLEGYPSYYDREEVTLEDGRICWAYFLPTEPYLTYQVVETGDWLKFLETKRERS